MPHTPNISASLVLQSALCPVSVAYDEVLHYKFFPPSCYFLLLRPKYISHPPKFENPQQQILRTIQSSRDNLFLCVLNVSLFANVFTYYSNHNVCSLFIFRLIKSRMMRLGDVKRKGGEGNLYSTL